MTNVYLAARDGEVQSSEGWVVRPISPNLLEYRDGPDPCLINVGEMLTNRARPIYASESLSELFPDLREHLLAALPFLKGSYILV